MSKELVEALKKCRSFLGDPANFDCYGTEEQLAEFLQRVKRDEQEAIALADAAIASYEAQLVESKPFAYWVSDKNGDGQLVKAEYCDPWRLIAVDVLPLYTRPQVAMVPEGWRLVPIEPTDAMIDAAFEASSSRVGIYQAMLAAVPQPVEKTCPPCNSNCNQGRDCPNRGE